MIYFCWNEDTNIEEKSEIKETEEKEQKEENNEETKEEKENKEEEEESEEKYWSVWQNGDIIGCGIEFDDNSNVKIHYCRNGEIQFSEECNINDDNQIEYGIIVGLYKHSSVILITNESDMSYFNEFNNNFQNEYKTIDKINDNNDGNNSNSSNIDLMLYRKD